MASAEREETLRIYASQATDRLVRAGDILAQHQAMGGPARGNVPPWHGSDDLDFHGTLSAIWIWSRAQALARNDHFSINIGAAWSFIETSWDRFVPPSLAAGTSDEAAYDCAMVLRAFLADQPLPGADEADVRADRAACAARLLAAYLADLDQSGGREFRDPGFLAWNLGDYAREVSDRGLASSARRFVEANFGMKSPPPFASETAPCDGLFDFSCTTATRVLAVLGAEGPTPFVGAWLRERVAPAVPKAFVARPRDENAWNACAATAVGRAFAVSTDPMFFDVHQSLLDELDRRAEQGALGRHPGFSPETSATFYYALAVDSLLSPT